MKIAYLILAHTDPTHIARLTKRLSVDGGCHIFIHVDKKVDITEFKELLAGNKDVTFCSNRISVSWGGYSSVIATLSLMREAFESYVYDRYVLLQGLDYPLLSNKEIKEFFIRNKDVEYIRACKINGSKEKLHSQKCECFYFFDNLNLVKRLINKFNSIFAIKLRRGYIVEEKKRYDIYWGCAQWALTSNCVKYILSFSEKHKKFNHYFKYVFPPDETYFHTIIFNSNYSFKTSAKGPEPAQIGLCNWRNLHYFEYPVKITVFNEKDYSKLINSGCMFFRKATTEKSSRLLDMIDNKILNN